MKKIVKCSGCGKEHEIESKLIPMRCSTMQYTKESITFKPVDSVRDKILREHGRICNDGRYPDILYLGEKEEESLRLETNACYTRNFAAPHGITKYLGFHIIELDKQSYFHATSKASE